MSLSKTEFSIALLNLACKYGVRSTQNLVVLSDRKPRTMAQVMCDAGREVTAGQHNSMAKIIDAGLVTAQKTKNPAGTVVMVVYEITARGMSTIHPFIEP